VVELIQAGQFVAFADADVRAADVTDHRLELDLRLLADRGSHRRACYPQPAADLVDSLGALDVK
jgi:hypothetical protein